MTDTDLPSEKTKESYENAHPEPEVIRDTRVVNSVTRSQYRGGLSLQGCNPLACFDAVRRCIRNPNPVQCILDIAPNCLDCIPH